MPIQGLHYRHVMITIFYSTYLNSNVASDNSTVEETAVGKAVKDECFLSILAVHHWQNAVCDLRVEGGYLWADEKHGKQQIIHRDGEEIEHTQAIKLCKVFNMMTAIVRTSKAFENITKGIISYLASFEL